MNDGIFKEVVNILTLVMGVCIPVFAFLIKKIAKDADDRLKKRDDDIDNDFIDRDKKIDKLFSICDEFRVCLTNKAQEIASIKTDIKWIKEAMQKKNGE